MIRAVIYTRRNRNACYPRLEASRPFWTFYLFIWLHLATFTILALSGSADPTQTRRARDEAILFRSGKSRPVQPFLNGR